jgi:hypothetical protein
MKADAIIERVRAEGYWNGDSGDDTPLTDALVASFMALDPEPLPATESEQYADGWEYNETRQHTAWRIRQNLRDAVDALLEKEAKR